MLVSGDACCLVDGPSSQTNSVSEYEYATEASVVIAINHTAFVT